MTQSKIKRWHSKRAVAAHYDVHPRTIERRAKGGKFPRGTQMPNGRWYWTDAEIEAHDRDLVGGGAA